MSDLERKLDMALGPMTYDHSDTVCDGFRDGFRAGYRAGVEAAAKIVSAADPFIGVEWAGHIVHELRRLTAPSRPESAPAPPATCASDRESGTRPI